MKKYIAEFLGTAFLLAIVAGSGIMGENLSQGNAAIALLANAIATGAGLFVLIQCVGPISGAHFNPAVTLVEFFWRRIEKHEALLYCLAQLLGALTGIFVAHLMFGLPLLQVSQKSRSGFHLMASEFVATFGLIMVIGLAGRKRVEWAPLTIAAYITSAYWFTSSTSFANPAVTFARAWTNTFCGIAPTDIWGFFLAQGLGAFAAFLTLKGLES
ncbi:MAG: aquaporin [Bdellovibrionales bacterium]